MGLGLLASLHWIRMIFHSIRHAWWTLEDSCKSLEEQPRVGRGVMESGMFNFSLALSRFILMIGRSSDWCNLIAFNQSL